MKHYFLLLSLAFGLQLSAQTTPEPTITRFTPPSIVAARFSGTYPNITPNWTALEDETYSAEYRVEDTNMGRIVRYDKNGNLLSLENEQHNDAYPVAISSYYIKKYPKEKYVIWLREDAAGNKTYYINRGEEKVWFDQKGKYLASKSAATPTPLSAKP